MSLLNIAIISTTVTVILTHDFILQVQHILEEGCVEDRSKYDVSVRSTVLDLRQAFGRDDQHLVSMERTNIIRPCKHWHRSAKDMRFRPLHIYFTNGRSRLVNITPNGKR